MLKTTNELVKKLELGPEELGSRIAEAMGNLTDEEMGLRYENSIQNFKLDSILKGRVLTIINDEVVVDVGYKSEGIIPLYEFADAHEVEEGDDIEVFLESVEDDSGLIVLSKKKADRIKSWEQLIATKKEGDLIRGRVVRKIKGGLLLDAGVPIFLPASQISIRRTGDISEYIGQELECQILKIDESRMNIVVSRRKLIEQEREHQKKKLLDRITEGMTVEGVVKNLADFGAFVDLGGIDGLLHITDMSWGRISHPSEMLTIDDKVEVKILSIDHVRERIALGLKQKKKSPWVNVDKKYPVGSRVKGRVVNVMKYGAFIKLETGIEGLVHISEMSWTRRINHPSEVVSISDIVDIEVLNINRDKQEISLGMKQTGLNPWTLLEEKYPPGTLIEGRVRNLTNYGAFVEIEEGIDGLLHISDMSWVKKVNHPSEMVKKGDKLQVQVISVDQEKKRVALGMKQLEEDPWEDAIPDRYQPGETFEGRVTKITNFGVFVELERDLEGLLHVSELAGGKVSNPEEVVQVGDIVQVQVLRVDRDERKIGLTLVSAPGVRTGDAAASGTGAESTEEPAAESTEEPAAESTEEPAAESTEEPAAEPTEAAESDSSEEDGGIFGSAKEGEVEKSQPEEAEAKDSGATEEDEGDGVFDS